MKNSLKKIIWKEINCEKLEKFDFKRFTFVLKYFMCDVVTCFFLGVKKAFWQKHIVILGKKKKINKSQKKRSFFNDDDSCRTVFKEIKEKKNCTTK